MRRSGTLCVLGLLITLRPASADFVDAGFCPSLRTAYEAGKQGSPATRGVRVAWGTCTVGADGTLSCTRHFGSDAEARRASQALKAATASCLSPLGLTPHERMIESVESTRFDGRDIDPSVAIYYVGPLVRLSILTAD